MVNALLMGDTTPLYLAAQRGFAEVVKVQQTLTLPTAISATSTCIPIMFSPNVALRIDIAREWRRP